jgi:NDP-sugar pyrophosphorylase family protein
MDELGSDNVVPGQPPQRDCAVVLAGGKGTRLRPYTTVLPKPLMPVGDMPILEVVVRQLKAHGFARAILAVNHQAALIKSYFGDGRRWGIDLTYSLEPAPLGTIGPLHPIADQLPDSFLVMNGDLLTDLDFAAFLDGHRAAAELLTVAVCRRTQGIDYGVVEIAQGRQRAVGFREKPELHLWVSAGVYAMDRAILQHVPKGRRFGFDDLMTALLQRRVPIAVHRHGGRWHDIGRTEDLEAAVSSFEADPHAYLTAEVRQEPVGALS